MTTFGTLIKHRFRRTIACAVAFFLILSHSAGVIAQSVPDIIPPTITPEIVSLTTADVNQVFTAQASDDRSLGDVSLHYRRSGESIFNRVIMQSVGDTGFFTVSIETDPNDLRAFEYYTQVLDLNGNRTVSGFAFEPFIRTLIPADNTTVTEVPNETPATSDDVAVVVAPPAAQNTILRPRSNRKWWYIAIGVLAVGAIAASQAGGGSDDGDITTDDDNVPLTINIGDPLP